MTIVTFKRFIFLFVLSISLSSYAQQPGDVVVGKSDITYYAKQGDTLISIAQTYTEKSSNWALLGKRNRIGNDRAIPIGTGIQIPFELLRELTIEAKVVAFSGEATLNNGSATSPITIGAIVREGMVVSTEKNGFATIELPDHSRISVPSNSQVKFSKLRATEYANSPKTELTLLTGRVESSVTSLKNNNGRFEVHSPLAIAGVRGTHFRVEATEHQVATEVLEGNVAVGQTVRPNAITLPAGKGDIVNAQKVGEAVALLPAPTLIGNYALQERILVQFKVVKMDEAKSYRAQIALDNKAENLIQEGVFTEPHFKFSDIADGNYFVRISAIDALGLEGFSNIIPFKLKARPEAPFNIQPKKKLRAEQVDFSWSEAADAAFYHLQIASDAEFQHLLQDHPKLSATHYSADQLPIGHFFWRVASISQKNGVDDHGPFGDVENVELLAPTKDLPPFKDSGGATMNLSWSAEPGQTFVLQMSDDAAFTHLILDQQLPAPEFNLPRPKPGIYFIRVKAIDADGYVGAFSGTQTITIFNLLTSSDGSPVHSLDGVVHIGF
ncbi:FecR domain-containing protein [Solimicrobium silvestre]|uniref:FecR protein n=1 Tax=Solimicrobium silvestre TaxID=2099400 RepID=A0A2S9H2M8_9BURK|nr:FecR domain-containing protein [Solimicrobium silvestre]PRC94231.1 FecR protein [Solimicrobium silvestre]